jgi:mono/diheme cytochrome c family protein
VKHSCASRFLTWGLVPSAISAAALLSLCLIPLSAQSQKPAPPAAATPAGNVQNGRKAFIQHGCFSCHGYSGEGGPGARLAQNPIPFPAFAEYVRRPKRSMPPFATQVTDQELADMYAFIKSIPPSPNAKDIPLLNNP